MMRLKNRVLTSSTSPPVRRPPCDQIIKKVTIPTISQEHVESIQVVAVTKDIVVNAMLACSGTTVSIVGLRRQLLLISSTNDRSISTTLKISETAGSKQA
uniref:Uncharacterized protein n=2 Tax=Grammatophora oceanica TaxID=210454 RepID=A0A7S1UX74_9STRA